MNVLRSFFSKINSRRSRPKYSKVENTKLLKISPHIRNRLDCEFYSFQAQPSDLEDNTVLPSFLDLKGRKTSLVVH